jgi:hypothetical protein
MGGNVVDGLIGKTKLTVSNYLHLSSKKHCDSIADLLNADYK